MYVLGLVRPVGLGLRLRGGEVLDEHLLNLLITVFVYVLCVYVFYVFVYVLLFC